MSRILIWSPNYAPELTGISPLVTHAAEWLAARGHEVTAVVPMPNYPEREIHAAYRGILWRTEVAGAVTVRRSWLRVRPEERVVDKALYEASFATASLPLVLRDLSRADAVVCVVPSLLAAAVTAAAVRVLRLVGRRPRFVLWVQDLVLEASTVVEGGSGRLRRVLDAARSLETFAAGTAQPVVVCSPGFGEYLIRHGADGRRIVTIYNGVDVNEITPEPPPPPRSRTQFLYIGNLGYTQDFETLVAGARSLPDEVEVEVYGQGNAATRVRELAATAPNVQVHRPVGWGALPTILSAADVHVLVQRRGIAHANLPSKIGPCLASGRPLLASLDLDSPAAELLRASGGALLVPPEDAATFATAMRTLHRDPE
ncbi:MAG: glycosyltransferase family 4 protein, partial [Gemmatimonadetes bacterium]|nr:glycosyltransferase family 4 protein [Gemmatimonadota bacterium]